MGGHSEEDVRESRSEPIIGGLIPGEELETEEVPDSLVAQFSSLTTPYCWVITADAVSGYDGAQPSAVGKSGPDEAVAQDVAEALATGRLYDPSGENELAALDDFGRQNLGALNIEFRSEGEWRAA